MKLDSRRIDGLLRDASAVRAVLLFGEDAGMVRDLGSRFVRAVAGSADDPFRVVELERDGYAQMASELASLSLTGGRRVVRVRDVADAATPHVQAALAGRGGGLLVLEGAALPARSKLRALLEKASDAAAVACYLPDTNAVASEIRAGLQTHGVSAEAEALRWLETRLGADLAMTRGEIEKLSVYAGAGGRVDLASAMACVGDLAGVSLEDALFAASVGDATAADRALELALIEGASAVGVVRAALLHVQRLHRARLAMAAGASATEAAKSSRPPLFFRREPEFVRALALWSESALAAASARLWDAERACKRTGAPADAVCRSAVIGMAQRAAVAARRL